MSIIHEALRKVQQNMQEKKAEKTEKVEVLPTATATPSSPKIEKKNQPPSWLLIIFSCVVIIGSSLYAVSQIRTKYPNFLPGVRLEVPNAAINLPSISLPKLGQTSSPAPTQSLKPMKIINPLKYISLPKRAPAAKPLAQVTISSNESTHNSPTVLNVKGIMADPKGNLALIDNEIYEEGAVIHGIKIVKINLNEIILERDGKQETIVVRK